MHLFQHQDGIQRLLTGGEMLEIPAILGVELVQPIEPLEQSYRPSAELTMAIVENDRFSPRRVCRGRGATFNDGHEALFSVSVTPARHWPHSLPAK
jgi:hypothetical protein